MGRVDVDGVGIEYDVTGDGPPVVLLHGFPDSGRLWRHQVPALAEAGFQVIAPDLRGYGRSGKPEAIEAYSLLHLAGDVMAIMAELQAARAHVVGHDWGAALAWALASFAPDTVDHLVALSVGHPATFRRAARQREKSWYMLLFQFPGIAERWLTEDDWSNFRTWAGHPDADQVIAELEATGSLTPGLNWYRANVPPESWVGPPLQLPPVQASTMGVWSTGDPALTEIQMTDSAENVAGPWRYERLDGPGHWMQLDAPDQVNALLLDFLRLSALKAGNRAIFCTNLNTRLAKRPLAIGSITYPEVARRSERRGCILRPQGKRPAITPKRAASSSTHRRSSPRTCRISCWISLKTIQASRTTRQKMNIRFCHDPLVDTV